MYTAVPMEVRASSVFGYNLGIKLIRGAYMNEERHLAQEGGYESPVHDTIEDTHACYNANLEHIIENMKATDALFIGSHNNESIEKAVHLFFINTKRTNVYFG
jgi:proline dehydrogenase